ncbi:MAG: sigma-54-dependent Fis family transcriptional regulator [Bdellovibrionaceae bacterium]|nr:sigma-54-dependent Fis family transcriptional regulator [Pseudobdellovibrionaceae bacterium]
MEHKAQHRVLMVDDDLKNIKATRGFFEINGLRVSAVQTADDAISAIQADEYALVLLDYQMPVMTGDTLAKKIREIRPDQQIVMYSCDQSRQALKDSYRAGAIDFIEKGEDPTVILSRVLSYCHRYDEQLRTVRPAKGAGENRKLIESVGMVGESSALAAVARSIVKFGRAGDVSVLVGGESGTGKELVAKALHDLSPRNKGPFIAINCAAIPKDLLESTLFGHKRGAFTGAVTDQDGKFVLADGGTLFLDEIGDLSLELQAKLLRVLQERVVEPVGSRTSKRINVRIVCATHKNIDELVRTGKFREDLMYRIKITEIDLPPLRERPEDIEPLIAHFTTITNKKYKFTRHFQHRTIEVLRKYSWPGNIRELIGVVERHLINSEDAIVRVEDLDVHISQPVDNDNKPFLTIAQLEDEHHKAKMKHILNTIDSSGTKVEAARRLGIKPNHLQYLLNESKAAKSSEAQR